MRAGRCGVLCSNLTILLLVLAVPVERTRAAVPLIKSFEPGSGVAGREVKISGENFDPITTGNIVYFGPVQGFVTEASSTNLSVRVPAGATFSPLSVTVAGLIARSATPFLPTFPGDGSPVGPLTLEPGFTIPAPQGPTTVVLADLDNDGKPDLILGNGLGRSLWLLRNISTNGTLTASSFEAPVTVAFPPGDPYKIAVADLDGDGKLDLIVSMLATSIISVFQNTTVGPGASLSLGPRIDLPVGADCRSARAVDLDGDGRLDIVTANYGDSTLSIIKNLSSPGNLSTNSFAPRLDLPAPSQPYDLAIGDLDGDSQPDIALAAYGQILAVYCNHVAGGLLQTNSFARTDFPAPPDTDTIELADIDGDGRLDVLVGAIHPLNMAVYRNLGGLPFTTNSLAERVEFSTGHWTHNLAVADFNGDGQPDVAAVGELESYLSIFQNLSTPGSFTAASLAPRVDYTSGWNAWGLALGDLDGDGRPDVAFCNFWDNTFTVYHNRSPYAGPPYIISEPASRIVALGDTTDFSVIAEGTSQLGYQWWHNQTSVPGAVGPTLSFPETQSGDAGQYFVVITNAYGAVTSTVVTLAFTNLAPYISLQPQDQRAPLNGSVSFSVTAGGTRPLSYQWRFGGTNLSGATSSVLNLTNLRIDQAGSYSVLVTNELGSEVSRDAQLTVIIPPSVVSIAVTNVISGSPVTIPITLAASGQENALSFSLVFGADQVKAPMLSFVQASSALESRGGILVLNTNLLAQGRMGLGLALPAGTAFAAGTQEVARLTFNTSIVTNTVPAYVRLSFVDQPVARQVSDPLAISLPAIFVAGTIELLPTDLEGDTSPRSGGNRAVTLNDWVQAGRFAAGLDVPVSESEFQRADCAPRSTSGDGVLNVMDWVQAGRYFAKLDPPQAIGGPTGALPPTPGDPSPAREVRALNVAAIQDLEIAVPMQMSALGNENALGFTLRFDPARVKYSRATLGGDAAGAALNINEVQASSGILGLVMALPAGQVFAPGTREVAKVFFIPKSSTGSASVAFGDGPVLRAVSDLAAQGLAANYLDGQIVVNPLPPLSIAAAATAVTIRWPLWATGFEVQTSSAVSPDADWTSLPLVPQTNGTELILEVPIANQTTFFRLHNR